MLSRLSLWLKFQNFRAEYPEFCHFTESLHNVASTSSVLDLFVSENASTTRKRKKKYYFERTLFIFSDTATVSWISRTLYVTCRE